MKRIVLLVLALVVGGGAFWLYRVLFPSDERAIRRTLQQAAEAVSIRPEQGTFDKLAAINRLLNLCHPDIEILLNAPGTGSHSIRGQDQLREAFAAVAGSGETLQVDLLQIGVEIRQDRSHATAQFIARARGRAAQEDIVQEFRVLLDKTEGRWIMRRIEPLPSLQL